MPKKKNKTKTTSYKTKYVQMSALSLAVVKRMAHLNDVVRALGIPTVSVVEIVKLMEQIHRGGGR